jgi:hypothetical protein
MKYSVFFTLALALAASARPARKGGRRTQSAAASSTAAAAAGTGNAAASTSVAAAASSAAAAAASSAPPAAANGTAATAGNSDPQSSLTLDPKVVATGFETPGGNAALGQVDSLTSSNNFINFCLTAPNLPITNGQQITTGSCNPAPMGILPAKQNMPSAKFTNPPNGGVIPANQPFTISVAIANLQTGAFTNAQANYFSAPQQLNAQGVIIGHSHVVVEKLNSLTQTTPTDPTTFAFFKGLNAAAQGGILTADVANGLPAGVYKVSTINTAANHQPAVGPIAQHGSFDDVVYFTVSDNAAAASAGLGSAATSVAAAASTDTAAAAAAAASSGAAAAAASTNAAAAAAASSSVAAAGSSQATASAASGAATSAAAAAAASSPAAKKSRKGKGKRMELSRSSV